VLRSPTPPQTVLSVLGSLLAGSRMTIDTKTHAVGFGAMQREVDGRGCARCGSTGARPAVCRMSRQSAFCVQVQGLVDRDSDVQGVAWFPCNAQG
jgi:hypothetical protein